jgi:hypothetical protein
MYDQKIIPDWDPNLKSYQIYDDQLGELKLSPSCYLVKIHFKSPMFLISERDIFDKRIEFYYKGVYYNFTSAICSEVRKEDLYFFSLYLQS